jgi:DNA-binding transcriptional ArsR family regulator
MKEINQVLLNPVRGRIIQYLSSHPTATAGDIALRMTDVPRTTLYRHLNVLVNSNILTVVAENRIRGSVERTYALNLQTFSEHNTNENFISNAFGFLMKIFGDFDRYFSAENPNPGADKVFLSNVSLLLSDEEFNELLTQLNSLLRRHLDNEPIRGRKQRSISIISSPCSEEEKQQ